MVNNIPGMIKSLKGELSSTLAGKFKACPPGSLTIIKPEDVAVIPITETSINNSVFKIPLIFDGKNIQRLMSFLHKYQPVHQMQ